MLPHLVGVVQTFQNNLYWIIFSAASFEVLEEDFLWTEPALDECFEVLKLITKCINELKLIST